MGSVRIIRFCFKDKGYLEQAFSIRTRVFVDEQGIAPELEYDDHEKTAVHFLLFLDEMAVATARWRETPEGIKLERFAVLKEHRNRGLGALILKEALNDVRNRNSQIYIHSQAGAVRFYERNGFSIEGDVFTEAGIPHFKMLFRS